jgi:hypothetical protein
VHLTAERTGDGESRQRVEDGRLAGAGETNEANLNCAPRSVAEKTFYLDQHG